MDRTNSAQRLLKDLYPLVDENKTPLPTAWNQKDKFHYLGLSQNNLRVHYKGQGKSHKDAAAVRATHPIPAACGLYYYEVKIVSKGRDGYMGIGFSQEGVNLNRLPGWDKNSYGYHGDDGCSFCSTGQGSPYGPTFTTGDIIGCGLNLVDNTCFYTKNGQNLGTAYTNLPPDLYPTVGLQTPGEIVEANFGQTPFAYDITQDLKEVQTRIRMSLENFPISGLRQECFAKLISNYLIHHGYCASASSFCQQANQNLPEDIPSIKNRHKIQKLILSGQISEAIEQLQELYPALLETNPDLFFMLRCRQFVEMVASNVMATTTAECLLKSVQKSHSGSPVVCSPSQQRAIGQKSAYRHSPMRSSPRDSPRHSPRRIKSPQHSQRSSPVQPHFLIDCDIVGPRQSNASNSTTTTGSVDCGNVRNGHSLSNNEDVSMDCPENGCRMETSAAADYCETQNGFYNKSSDNVSSHASNGNAVMVDAELSDDVDMIEKSDDANEFLGEEAPQGPQVNSSYYEKLLQFGRDLQQMNSQLRSQSGPNAKNNKMLHDAFSLLAYKDPFKSPVSYQLSASQREHIASAVNRAILAMFGQPSQPSLEVLYCQSKRLRQEMAKAGLGCCAFIDPDSYLAAT